MKQTKTQKKMYSSIMLWDFLFLLLLNFHASIILLTTHNNSEQLVGYQLGHKLAVTNYYRMKRSTI